MVSHPVPGGHITLASRFVDPSFSFTLGWNYWYNWTIVLPAELNAAGELFSQTIIERSLLMQFNPSCLDYVLEQLSQCICLDWTLLGRRCRNQLGWNKSLRRDGVRPGSHPRTRLNNL